MHRGIYLQLHTKHDADVLTKLDHSQNKQGYIKQLIRDDIKKSKSKGATENDYSAEKTGLKD